ncbi:MAG: hypothetical protein OXG65_13500 [Chloroflexi bacterium]|nr:hypothetical protein [Chloroflexota bacterium]
MITVARAAVADERGSISGLTPLLLVLSLLLGALVIDINGIRGQRLRFGDALEQAAVVAAGEVDAHHLAATGEVRLSDHATAVAREYLRLNLRSVDGLIAGSTADAVATSAQIAVTAQGGFDPIRKRSVAAPTVSIRAEVPVRTGLLRLAGLPAIRALPITASATTRS